MNNSKPGVQIVETILPTIEDESDVCIEENGLIPKCEQEAIKYETLDENGFIHTQNGFLVMASVPQVKTKTSEKRYSAYSNKVHSRKQYSSATIVGAGEVVPQNEMEVTTIHVLDLEDASGNMEVAYDNAVQVPVAVETLEVPVETLVTENDEIQSIHIGDYATVVSPTDSTDHETQSGSGLVIASAYPQQNCFVTVQENQVLSTPSGWNKSQLPTVTRVVQPKYPIGSRDLVRFGRSRMIADKLTNIPVAEFKAQLNDTSDIMGKMDLAPTTKKMMNYLSTKGFGKLFSSPGKKMCCAELLHLYTRHLTLKQVPVEETFDDMVLLPLGYQREVDPTKIKRITRRRRYPEAEEYQRRLIQEQMQQTFDNLVAESQKNMEAVFLENSGSLTEEDQGNLQILVQAAENDSLEHEGKGNHLGTQPASSDQEDCSIQAHSENLSSDNLPSGDWLGTVQQFIIIVPSDPLVDNITETVITS